MSGFAMSIRSLAIAGVVAAAFPAFAADKPVAKPNTKAASVAPKAPPAPAVDTMSLDAATIRGQQALPKVLNIVPWKRAGAGGMPGRPDASLLDDVLSPLDRGEVRRQLRYQRDINTEAATAASDNAAPQTKKE